MSHESTIGRNSVEFLAKRLPSPPEEREQSTVAWGDISEASVKHHTIPRGWKWRRLADLIEKFDAGISVNGGDRPAMAGECGVLKISAITEGRFREIENKVIEGVERDRVSLHPKRDRIIISRANTPELIGANAYIERDYPDVFLSDKLWQLEPKEVHTISMRWLGFVLSSPSYRKKMSEIATGSSQSMKNISQDAVMKLELPVPPHDEQVQVANLLNEWDSAIDKTERLISAKQKRNDEIGNRLLFGVTRFGKHDGTKTNVLHWFTAPADWKAVEIGDIAEEKSVQNGTQIGLPVLSCTKHDGLVDSLRYFNKQIFSYDTAKYKVVERGQFAYATNHIEEGSIGYQEFLPAGLVSPIYTVFQPDTERIDNRYFYKLLKSEKMRQIFAARTNASVDRRGSLRWKDFARIPIALPSLTEQRKISQLLDEAAHEVALLQREVGALKTQKRGLMQKLLTGQWRVPLSVTEATEVRA